jgi:hypothetical protein
MRLLLLSFVFLTFGFSVAQSNSENSSQTNVIQEPKPKYTEDIAKEEKKLSKKEKAKLKKWRAPRKAEPQKAKADTGPEKSTEDQIKDEDQSDLTPPE